MLTIPQLPVISKPLPTEAFEIHSLRSRAKNDKKEKKNKYASLFCPAIETRYLMTELDWNLPF